MNRIVFEPKLGKNGKPIKRYPKKGEWFLHYLLDPEGMFCRANVDFSNHPFPIYTRREEPMEPKAKEADNG